MRIECRVECSVESRIECRFECSVESSVESFNENFQFVWTDLFKASNYHEIILYIWSSNVISHKEDNKI